MIIKQEKEKDSNLLSLIWMGTNCKDQKTFEKILRDINPSGSRESNEVNYAVDEINDNWKRLASLRYN